MTAAFLTALLGLIVIWLSPLWFLDMVGVAVVLFAIVIAIDNVAGRRW